MLGIALGISCGSLGFRVGGAPDGKVETLAWNNLMLDLERYTPGYRPPVSARMFAYVEMAAYEAALPDLQGYVSMEQYCPGYVRPAILPAKGQFHLPSSINAAYAQILRDFFPTTPEHLKKRIDDLEDSYARRFHEIIDANILYQSKTYGQSVSKAVWQWSATDKEGHDAFYTTSDRNYVADSSPGCWHPQGKRPLPPLLPNWKGAQFCCHYSRHTGELPRLSKNRRVPDYTRKRWKFFRLQSLRKSLDCRTLERRFAGTDGYRLAAGFL